MVDSGVNHNFIREDVVKDIGLQLETMKTTFKYANLGVEKDIFTTKEILLKLGDCTRPWGETRAWGETRPRERMYQGTKNDAKDNHDCKLRARKWR